MKKTENNRLRNQTIMDDLFIKCPAENFIEKETNAYRWVFEEIEDERNFMPQYLKQPKRFNTKPPKVICQSLGISLYHTKEHARKKFLFLKRQLTEKAYEYLGTKIAEGQIKPIFGLTNDANEEGHFTHYPYETIELKEYFKIKETL